MDLADRKCIPCTGGTSALAPEDTQRFKAETPEWSVIDNHHLARTFHFPDFQSALSFVNRLGAIAEEQGHHPDIFLTWGKVMVTVWTHKIDGLTQSDFVLAAKIDREWNSRPAA